MSTKKAGRRCRRPIRINARVGRRYLTTLEDFRMMFGGSLSDAMRRAIRELDRHLDRTGRARPSQQERAM